MNTAEVALLKAQLTLAREALQEARDLLPDAAFEITRLRALVLDLVTLMERSDAEEFGNGLDPVSAEEWYGTIRRARAAIQASEQ